MSDKGSYDLEEDTNVELEALINLPSPAKAPKTARFQVAQVGSQEDEENPLSGDENQSHHGSTMQKSIQNTLYAKSLRYYLTREALPSESNYRNLLSFGAQSSKMPRPTLEELREETSESKDLNRNSIKKSKGDGEDPKTGVIKFGWIEGVFMRCLLNIWGVMLFLRLTWVVGQCGIIQGLLVITLCNVVTVITSVSMSAVSTNGQIKGGGVYFMISRALGPEFGGAIGLMFTLANSIAVAMYVIGFCESLLDMLRFYIEDFDGIVDKDFENTNFRLNDVRIIGSVTLVLLLVLAVVGMQWVTRVQKLLLVLLIFSQLDFMAGTFISGDVSERAKGFTGWSMETAQLNVNPAYTEGESFFSVFGIFFPAVTGIVAGANLSGDLKDPGVAIPKGTLGAIALTYVTYVVYAVMVGATYLPMASGNVTEYSFWHTNEQFNTSLPEEDWPLRFNDCPLAAGNESWRECKYGSARDQQSMSIISYTGWLIYAGCFAATLSSAIASLVGAPRVLQALAKDQLYPKIGVFAKGMGANNDPVRGYVVVFLVALGCIILGELNMVSTLLSNFFVAAYALINFSVFHASITKSPGWRPSFKWYNPWMSLGGTIICVAVMFLMDWVTGLLTFFITIVLYLYIHYRKPEANWGSSAQAQVFVSAMTAVQNLTDTADHVKNYRPKVLLLSGNPAYRPPLIDFANLITKKISLLICAHVITDSRPTNFASLKETVQLWLADHKIKGFYALTQNASFEEGSKSCMTLAGLGKLSPNMVLMGYKNDWKEDMEALRQYFNVINSAFDLHLSVGILRVKNGLDYSKHIAKEEQVVVTSEQDATNRDIEASLGDGDGSEQGETDSNKVLNLDSKDSTPDSKDSTPDSKDSTPAPTQPEVVVKDRSSKRGKKVSTAVYHGPDGKPLSKEIVADITQFQTKKRKGNIDVWWLYDDGGLTLLLPYILTTRQQFKDCKLRVFSLANRKDELDRETRNMATLLAKFRIDYSDVIVIPDITKKAEDATLKELTDVIEELPEGTIDQAELQALKEKTNRHLRLAELLRSYSKESEMVMMTLPMPRKGHVSPPLYMSWLEVMTRDLPPVLLIRGNQTSVLTFYS